ncbi:MAG: AMP-binding protein, partial [Burkholderiales bacterium]|nr:AMP-binding protein [Opitutaceae bacterium]
RLEDFARREALEGFRVATLAGLRQEQPESAWHQPAPDDLALLLLTSGSTGLPKAVRQTHRNLLAWAGAVRQHCGFTPADVSLNWMPLDHVGGLVMFHLRDVVVGCRQIHAMTEPVLQRPLAWLEWMEKHRVTITWAPNFAFGLINEQEAELAKKRYDLSALAFVLNGGEAIVSRTARRFLRLLAPHGLPATAMRPSWGMSETCSSVVFSRFTLADTTDDAPFVEVGRPIPGTQVRIVDGEDRLVPAGKIGRLQIKGVSITPGYHQNPEVNEKSYTSDGWFITGDLAVLKDGELSITGREKDVIIVNGVNFYSQEIESVVEQVPGVEVSFTAACAIRLPAENTDRIAVFFSPTEAGAKRLPDLLRDIRSAVVSKEAVNPDYVLPLPKDAIPKTAIGKIQRAQLKQLFERGDFQALVKKHSSHANEPASTPDWFYRPGWIDAPLTEGALPAGASFLFFADREGALSALARELSSAGHACTVVESAEEFAQSGQTAFRLSPGNLDHYTRLLALLPALPDCVVHGFTLGGDGPEPDTLAQLEDAQGAGA